MRSTFSIRRPSASMIVALVALFAALGGTGYAAATLSGRDIQRRSIPGNRVMNNALGGGQINESRLGVVPAAREALSAQTAASATTAGSATTAESAQTAQRAQDAVNAQNAVNAQSAQDSLKLQGRDATAFMANTVRVDANGVTVANGGSESVSVSCQAGEKGIAGGAGWFLPAGTPSENDAQLNSSYPLPGTGTNTMTGWRAVGRNNAGGDRVLRAYVVCVPKTA
jgi:hypothetical protein